MNKTPQSHHATSANTPSPDESRSPGAARLDQFEKRQNELWRLTFLLLFVLSIVFAFISWDSIRSFSHRFEALPIGLVVLVFLFGAYMWRKTQEISEMRGLMRGIETRDTVPPSDRQLDQLFEMVSRSQQGYRDLIDSFDDLLLAFDLDGHVRAVNRSFAAFVGLPFQEIVGHPISDFVEEASGAGQELVRRCLPKFLERRQWADVVQIRLKGKQQVFYFDCVAHPMQRGDAVHGVTILARDVTSLRKNEARFTELFETLQEGIYIATPSGDILDANPALVRMLGYASKEELLAKKVEEIFTNYEDRKLLKRDVERQMGLEGREITLLRKDGSSVICLNTAAAVRDASGSIVRYQGALMDITERREMERRLHKEQEFARRLIDSFPDLIFVLDTASRYTFISPSIYEILGYTVEEEKQLPFGACAHPEDRPSVHSLFAEILAGQKSFASLELRVRHKQGDYRRLRCNFSPLWDENGKIVGVVISGRDVTELKRLEEQLIQAEKLAAMGQMLAGVAHELNNPLTAILGATELLRERQGTDENTKRQLDLTHRQARRAARIVQNLLEFSRPASPQKQPVDLNSIIERMLQLHEHSLRSNGVSVDFQPQADLPGVIGDANQLIQVFLNLVTNAEQAIREVRTSGRIQIRISRNLSRLLITVQDDGVGIKPEIVNRIFDPFYTTKRPGGGTGLGLSICTSIIREHGGNIEAESLPAGGAAFTVYLPVVEGQKSVSRPARKDSSSAEWVRPAAATFRGRSVLVLDDEESIRMLLEEGLSAHGLHVNCAATAEEAMAFILDRSYDVLLCDLKLSGSGANADGAQVAERILLAAGDRRPAAILMTGDLVETTEVKPGEPRRLQKPFRISDVLVLVREIIDGVSPAATKL